MGAGAICELAVVCAGALLGVGARSGHELAHGGLRPGQVRLRGCHDRVGLGTSVGKQFIGVGLRPAHQRLRRCAGRLVTLADRRQHLSGPGLRLSPVRERELLRLATQTVELRQRALAQGVQLGGVGGVLTAPPLLVGTLVVGQTSDRQLVLATGLLEDRLGGGPSLRQLGLGLLGREAQGLIAGLGRPGSQQRSLVGGVGEHDLDLGAGLLEPAGRLGPGGGNPGAQVVQLVTGLLRLGAKASGFVAGGDDLAVGLQPQVVGQGLCAGQQGQRFRGGVRGGRTSCVPSRLGVHRPV